VACVNTSPGHLIVTSLFWAGIIVLRWVMVALFADFYTADTCEFINKVIYACLALAALLFASSPGLDSVKEKYFHDSMKDEGYYPCSACKNFHRSKSQMKWCFKCQLCIKTTSNHCFVAGKCITKNNQMLFL
jgi:hypothetical protein